MPADLSFRILEFLRDGSARTEDEIAAMLRNRRHDFRLESEGPDELHEMLQRLRDISVLQTFEAEGEKLHWVLATAASGADGTEENEAQAGGGNDGEGDGGGGGEVGDDGAGGAFDGAGGVGLGEVLAHPILFCLRESDQDAAIDAALRVVPPQAEEQQ